MNPDKVTQAHIIIRRPRTALAFLLMARGIVEAVGKSKATFPAPNPPLRQLASQIAALDAAQTATFTRTKGTAQARDAKIPPLVTSLVVLRAYVQQVADADPPNAVAIAHSAGMDVRKTPVRTKNDIDAKPGDVSGVVIVSARVGAVRACHEWQYSTDGGTAWIHLSPTLQGKTTITGLEPATYVSIRHRPITKTGGDNWSQPVTVLVH